MSHHFSRVLPVLAICALLSSCGAPDTLGLRTDRAPALGGAPIRTDSAVYHVRTTAYAYELTIGLTYTNPSGETAYISTCKAPDPPVLEKWEDGKWVTAFAPVVLMCLGPPVVIGAGERYAYTYHVLASHRPDTYPQFEVAEIPGTYRLVWRILGTWTPDGGQPGPGEELPLESRISNSFRIAR
jgi:hypothetical protein